MFRMLTGSEFQAAGPATANELSAKRVLVRRTTKLPRADDRRPLEVTAATANIGHYHLGDWGYVQSPGQTETTMQSCSNKFGRVTGKIPPLRGWDGLESKLFDSNPARAHIDRKGTRPVKMFW